jgi:dynein light intermediate chain 1
VASSDSAHLSLLPLALSSPADARASSSSHAGETQASESRVSKVTAEAEANGSRIATKARPSIDALRDSLFLITLDWEAPWTFLSQLVEWLDVVREIAEQAANTSKGGWSREQVVWEEMKESLEASIRAYNDIAGPVGTAALSSDDEDEVGENSVASAIVPVANPAAVDGEESAPLPEGCLTHNYGVPLVVVCTKADTIGQLERDRNFKEEKFDYVQQVLRTICLKCE